MCYLPGNELTIQKELCLEDVIMVLTRNELVELKIALNTLIDLENMKKKMSQMQEAGRVQTTEHINCSSDSSAKGWFDIDIAVPTPDTYILLSFSNFSIPCIGRYEEDENGGVFYIGDEDKTCVSQDLFVNAWQPLPEPYQKNEAK